MVTQRSSSGLVTSGGNQSKQSSLRRLSTGITRPNGTESRRIYVSVTSTALVAPTGNKLNISIFKYSSGIVTSNGRQTVRLVLGRYNTGRVTPTGTSVTLQSVLNISNVGTVRPVRPSPLPDYAMMVRKQSYSVGVIKPTAVETKQLSLRKTVYHIISGYYIRGTGTKRLSLVRKELTALVQPQHTYNTRLLSLSRRENAPVSLTPPLTSGTSTHRLILNRSSSGTVRATGQTISNLSTLYDSIGRVKPGATRSLRITYMFRGSSGFVAARARSGKMYAVILRPINTIQKGDTSLVRSSSEHTIVYNINNLHTNSSTALTQPSGVVLQRLYNKFIFSSGTLRPTRIYDKLLYFPKHAYTVVGEVSPTHTQNVKKLALHSFVDRINIPESNYARILHKVADVIIKTSFVSTTRSAMFLPDVRREQALVAPIGSKNKILNKQRYSYVVPLGYEFANLKGQFFINHMVTPYSEAPVFNYPTGQWNRKISISSFIERTTTPLSFSYSQKALTMSERTSLVTVDRASSEGKLRFRYNQKVGRVKPMRVIVQTPFYTEEDVSTINRAASYDLIIEPGATFFRWFRWIKNTGIPYDLNRFSLYMGVSNVKGSDETIISFPGDISIRKYPNGLFSITIPSSITSTLSFIRAVYTIRAGWAGNTKFVRLLEGEVILRKEAKILV